MIYHGDGKRGFTVVELKLRKFRKYFKFNEDVNTLEILDMAGSRKLLQNSYLYFYNIVLLFQGKSLDKIMELKEKKVLQKQKFAPKKESTPSIETNIFKFINKTLSKCVCFFYFFYSGFDRTKTCISSTVNSQRCERKR
jgi:hypothetical protein